ncbi:hypothetical protein [Pedobacter frigiditerrae]|uniref:hypothetical protein n=1 Tax=Pedobacter frigiditerrae TaxID=2530452 RepID=UPI00292F8C1A|nr:hypothetical protein [Pedobacter frigiditerrae]
MHYSKEFNELIETSIESYQYIGLGNPNAKILIVGKEAGSPIGVESTHGGGTAWKNKVDYSTRFKPIEDNLRSRRHTWQKYQKLYEIILDKLKIEEKVQKEEEYEITFVENIFTTELSNLPAPKTSEAKKQENFKAELEKRKVVFWKSEFIKQFPIVIIVALDNKYIETYSGEVCELFGVKFSHQNICESSDKCWIHYAEENKKGVLPKMVIHARQLTNGASNELLDKIAEEVKEFIERYSLNIVVK